LLFKRDRQSEVCINIKLFSNFLAVIIISFIITQNVRDSHHVTCIVSV